MGQGLMGDRWLMKLWRRAVLKKHNGRCVYCGHEQESNIEIHHRVHRRNMILRWDWRNGIPVCGVVHYGNRHLFNGKTCHQHADSLAGKRSMKKHEEHLSRYEHMTLKEYLALTGMSNKEFRLHKAAELKKILGEQ